MWIFEQWLGQVDPRRPVHCGLVRGLRKGLKQAEWKPSLCNSVNNIQIEQARMLVDLAATASAAARVHVCVILFVCWPCLPRQRYCVQIHSRV
jgi:hypothetical protein